MSSRWVRGTDLGGWVKVWDMHLWCVAMLLTLCSDIILFIVSSISASHEAVSEQTLIGGNRINPPRRERETQRERVMRKRPQRDPDISWLLFYLQRRSSEWLRMSCDVTVETNYNSVSVSGASVTTAVCHWFLSHLSQGAVVFREACGWTPTLHQSYGYKDAGC